LEVPLYYILRRGLQPEQVEAAALTLSITPCQAVFISNHIDAELALHFSDQVFSADSEALAILLAKRWAEDIGRPMLVVGDAEFIDAVFPDGHREAIVANA
jgi:hypothetical protein